MTSGVTQATGVSAIGTDVNLLYSLSSQSSRRRRAVWLGDSQSLRNNSMAGTTTITAVTVPNTSEIKIAQSTHRTVPGNWVNLAWINHPLLLGRTVQVTNVGDENNANLTSFWRFANPGIAPGTTISAVGANTMTGTALCYTKDQGFQSWINLLCGGIFDWVGMSCANGATSSDLVSFLPMVLAGPQFDDLFLLTGANDVNGLALATSKANVLNIVRQVTALGKRVFLLTPTPVGTAVPGQPRLTLPLRDYYFELSKIYPGVTVFDLHQWLVDSSTTTDEWLSGYTSDNLHQIAVGAYNGAKGFQTDILPHLFPTPPNMFPQSRAEDPNVSSYSGGNILFNPMLNGTGGTMTGGTGTVADSYRVINTGLTTCVGSQVARSDGKPGIWQQVSCTGTGNFTFQPTGQTVEARITGGQWYQFGFELSIAGTGITEIRLDAAMTLTDLLTNSDILTIRSMETAAEAFPSPFIETFPFLSESFFIPNGWTVQATYAPNFRCTLASGSATVKIARPFLRPVTGI